ncbi:hypothetical protein GpartN1_g6829.t1 [Galdieria partita]|uniref:Uncharacterized protein n=1 Tax=Galdieria partita TaxID=83374 RepID=A0A9C7UTN6_9RHOD|nr:hypothetical protein GpartN1_g6829.t1 [Galdieria partita]
MQSFSKLQVRVEDLLSKVNQLLSDLKMSESISQDWKESFREQLFEKYVSIVTLEHLLRRDLETCFLSSSEWILRPKVPTEETLGALPDLLRTKPDQEYLKYLNGSYSFCLKESKLDEKDARVLNLQLLSMPRVCNALIEKVEGFLERESNVGSQVNKSVEQRSEKSVENSLSWLAYEKGVDLS